MAQTAQINTVDYSSRRGAIVHLFPQIYALCNETRGPNDGDIPQNLVIWTRETHAALLDISKKWVFAMRSDDGALLGFLFYTLEKDARSLYINELRVARKYEKAGVAGALLAKLQSDAAVKACTDFYLGRHIRRERSEEILETVGLGDKTLFDAGGYQHIGNLADAVGALTLRYQPGP